MVSEFFRVDFDHAKYKSIMGEWSDYYFLTMNNFCLGPYVGPLVQLFSSKIQFIASNFYGFSKKVAFLTIFPDKIGLNETHIPTFYE